MTKQRNWREVLGLTAFDYAVPVHANTFWYSLGGITLFSFLIAFISGAILTQFYNPTPDAAHSSVRFMAEAPFVGLIRGLHYWSVNFGFGLLIVHLLRVLFTAAYRSPRTVNYLAGIALLITVYLLYFTGMVAKWDQEAIEALEHFMQTAKLLGPLGIFFSDEFTISTSMLARLYSLHVGVLPGLLIVIVVLHLLYVRHFGISPKPSQSLEEYEKSKAAGHTFSQHIKKLFGYSLILMAILLGLAYLFPPGLLNAPILGVEATKPAWPFWIFYPLEGVMGIRGILVGSFVILFALIMIPFLGLIIRHEKRRYLVANLIVTGGVITWIALLVITYFSPVVKHF
jgi:ubiquinol-cytochrome c reductase cytochrome b subunit